MSLHDYLAPLNQRVMSSGDPLQRSVRPSASANGGGATMDSVVQALGMLPDLIIGAWRRQGLFVPREAQAFLQPSTEVNVPNTGEKTAIVSFRMPERFTGFLTDVSLGVSPSSNSSDVKWYLDINGVTHPNFSGLSFPALDVLYKHPFPFEITQSKTVTLLASNTGGQALTCMAILYGWSEFITDQKKYGSTPSSGVI